MKKSKDRLITAISKNKKIHGYIAFTPNTLKFAQKNHNMNMISTSIFGRALTASVLLSGNLKNQNDILTLNWNCTGAVDNIFVEVNYDGKLRGNIGNNNLDFINGSLVNGFISSEPYIGLGEIMVSRKAFGDRAPYQSVSVIESGKIAEDISLYIKQSLQIDSAINIGISIDNKNKVGVCGGILLMAMPDVSDKEIMKLQSNFLSLGSYTKLLQENSDSINNVIDKILKTFNLEILNEKEITFKCNCSKKKIINILGSLKNEEFSEYITENGLIEATCQYCGKNYSFLPKEVKKL